MRTARFLLALASLAALLVFAAPAWADTISVPNDYKTIQEAVDAAARGDTVWVAAGVYEETVVIKQAMTLCGAGSDQTIIDGGGKGHVIQVVSDDDIYIRRLAVRNGSMDESYAGIDLYAAGGCVIEDCVATTTWAGIRFTDSHENTVRGCTFMDVEYGVDIGDTGSYGNMHRRLSGGELRDGRVQRLRRLRRAAHPALLGDVLRHGRPDRLQQGLDGRGLRPRRQRDRHRPRRRGRRRRALQQGRGQRDERHVDRRARFVRQPRLRQPVLRCGRRRHRAAGRRDRQLHPRQPAAGLRHRASTSCSTLASPNVGNVFFRNAFWRNAAPRGRRRAATSIPSPPVPVGQLLGRRDRGGRVRRSGSEHPRRGRRLRRAVQAGRCGRPVPGDDARHEGAAHGDHVPAPDGVWVSTPYVEFTWEGADDRTPPEYLGFSCSLDDAPWAFDGATTTFFEELAEGEHTFAVMARDGMGFEDSTPASVTFGVDLTAPLTEDSGDTAWHKTDTTVYFNAYDELSGVDYTEYSLNGGGSWTTGSEVTIPAPSDGSGDGVWNIVYRSVDVAGNVEATRGCSVKIAAGFALRRGGRAGRRAGRSASTTSPSPTSTATATRTSPSAAISARGRR